MLYWIGGVVGIMAMIGAFHYRARLRPSNWLVRLRPDQMLVKFRSHLNDHFNEEDPVVAAIPFAEIAWVRKTRERLMTPSSSDTHTTQVSWHTYLDVKLNSPETEELKETLTTERNRPAPKSREDELKHQLFQARKQKVSEAEISVIKESLKTERARKKPKMRGSGTRHHHYPVRMADSEILRVEWGGVKPKIKSILKMLNGKVHVEPELYLKTDHTLTPAENDMDSRILDLAERGKIMDAISMVRQQYGFSLTRSKEFVEELKKS
ncbi:MAG: hypothetical protein NPINA01_11690 [Nitrospinaceae bacterium]|nr:MAG: hypothetical protein NPINA01_11690 [Nitrospinaceae bacterium]